MIEYEICEERINIGRNIVQVRSTICYGAQKRD